MLDEVESVAQIGSYSLDVAAGRWSSSKGLDRIFGIDAAFPRSVEGWASLIHPADRAGLVAYLADAVLGQGEPFDRQYRIVRHDDRDTRWVHGRGFVERDTAGRPVRMIGTIADVTEHHRAEFEMRRLATAIEQSADAVVITDAAGAIEYVNPAFERVSGYARAEVLGRNPRILKSDAQGPEYYAAMWAALTSGQSFAGDLTNRRKDGSLFQEEAVISPIHDGDGTITSYVAVKRDVTRERGLEAAQERVARERALIAGALAGLAVGQTPADTAKAICRQVVGLTGIASAALVTFTPEGPCTTLAFVRADGEPGPIRRIPLQRSRQLLERAEEGPWVEAWVRRPRHPFQRAFQELGIRAQALAPVSHGGRLIGLFIVSSARPNAGELLTEALPALLEFAGVAGALVGPAIAGLTEVGQARERIADVIRTGAFRPVFQPIVDLGTGMPIGYEALTRFADGTAPDAVFAEARGSGLGAELELATLAVAIEAAERLPRDCWLSLNVSPDLALHSSVLPSLLAGQPRDIVLEITEHAEIDDHAAVRTAVAGYGPRVSLAVDDVGAGFANLSHVVELRPRYLKLDISLVRHVDRDPTRQAMIAGLRHFATQSNSVVIAEGIEVEAERLALVELGLQFGQGFLLGRPAPAPSGTPGTR